MFIFAVRLSWLLSLLLAASAAAAQQDSQEMKACDLLTSAELEAVIGGAAGHPRGHFSPRNSKYGLNGDSWSCEWMGGAREVRISYNTLQATEEAKKLHRDSQERLRDQGYQTQVRDVGGSHCFTVVVQSGSKDELGLVGTGCERDRGQSHVTIKISATGPKDLIAMERVAALTEKAVSRIQDNSR